MRFSEGQLVEWTAHSGTKKYRKVGRVAFVLESDEAPGDFADDIAERNYTISANHENACPRSGISYLVAVEGSRNLYWPVTSKLRLHINQSEKAAMKKKKKMVLPKVGPSEYWSLLVMFHNGSVDIYQSPHKLNYMKIGDSYKLVVQDQHGVTAGEIGECQIRYVASITRMQPKKWSEWGLQVHHVNGGFDAGREPQPRGLGESCHPRQDDPIHEEAGRSVPEPASVQ